MALQLTYTADTATVYPKAYARLERLLPDQIDLSVSGPVFVYADKAAADLNKKQRQGDYPNIPQQAIDAGLVARWNDTATQVPRVDAQGQPVLGPDVPQVDAGGNVVMAAAEPMPDAQGNPLRDAQGNVIMGNPTPVMVPGPQIIDTVVIPDLDRLKPRVQPVGVFPPVVVQGAAFLPFALNQLQGRGNLIGDGYAILKTLPEFAGAVDV